MDEANANLPIYSYKKFKELADDRMALVKIFVQRNDNWEPSGKGTIKYYQMPDQTTLREVKSFSELSTEVTNFFFLIDGTEVDDVTPEEADNLRCYQSLLKMRDFKSEHIVAFYDLMYGVDFEYDIDSWLNRKSYLVDSHQGRSSPDWTELRLRRSFQQNLGIYL